MGDSHKRQTFEMISVLSLENEIKKELSILCTFVLSTHVACNMRIHHSCDSSVLIRLTQNIKHFEFRKEAPNVQGWTRRWTNADWCLEPGAEDNPVKECKNILTVILAYKIHRLLFIVGGKLNSEDGGWTFEQMLTDAENQALRTML